MKLPTKEVICICVLAFTQSAIALNQCDEAREKATTAIKGQYAPFMSEIENVEKQMVEQGLDPTKFPQFDKNGKLRVVDLPALRSDLSAQQQKDVADVRSKIKSRCDDQLKPVQDIVDASKAVATLGISMVLPKRMTNIDVSDVLAGRPLGSNNAAIPKARDDILTSVGMGGKNNDVGRVLKNPLQPKKWLKR
ncbi:hypothetical protein WKW80_35400 [Variovorax humicola]|uniref:Uncharacterized protein n=1 Tax=Variovorax humicola TaxID=1769758 RepID=A0ABU8WCX0_9BURK